MRKTKKYRLYEEKRKKNEEMLIAKKLSKCSSSIRKLVQYLIKETAKPRRKILELLKENEDFKKRLLDLRKELLKQCHIRRKLQEQLNRKKTKENIISLPN